MGPLRLGGRTSPLAYPLFTDWRLSANFLEGAPTRQPGNSPSEAHGQSEGRP